MPDGAFEETEVQFLELLDAASGRQSLGVRLYSLPGIPHGEAISRRIATSYSSLEELEQHAPDVLIVTGANPVERRIEDEPFWSDLAWLLSWASEHVPTMLLSCLSAHAALAVFDGIERLPLATKCTGVFAQDSDPDNPLVEGLGRSIHLPHSRRNHVPIATMRAAGYELPLYSGEAGWSVATRTVRHSAVVLMQAHPEYGATSLLREYQRDARRFVLAEREEFPVLPLRCVSGRDWRDLVALQRRILDGDRSPELVEAFPFRAIGNRAPRPWRKAAARLYVNWLATAPIRGR